MWGSRLWGNNLEIKADFPDTHDTQQKVVQAHRKELRAVGGGGLNPRWLLLYLAASLLWVIHLTLLPSPLKEG